MMNKKNDDFFEPVKLQAYYSELTKSEKSDFLKYLMVEFDYGYASLQAKMTGKASLNKRDIILIGKVIKDELWKQ
ncbi:MAG: hypothetical protein K5683_02925 [Prevotella sp.]|nr:hypothetical protein [Prevotella sp.]